MGEKNVEQRLSMLEQAVLHDESVVRIRNLMHAYAMYFSSGDCDGILSCFSGERDDIELFFGRSKISGKDAIRDFYSKRPVLACLPGTFVTHEMTAEAIEVAEDGKTARATAYSPGLKGLSPADSQVNLLGRYYMELVHEEDGWKLWHLQWALTADADFNYGWLFQNSAYYIEDDYPALSEEPRPDMKLEKADAFLDLFKPDEVQRFLPEPPQPYETWDGYGATRNTREY